MTGVLANDTDTEANPLTAVLVSDVASGTLILDEDGSFTYQPAANFNGEVTFTYKANDGNSDSNVATVTLTVTAVNDAPVVTDIPGETIAEGGSFATISLDDYVSDVDDADAEMSWGYSGTTSLLVNINATTRVATISAPDGDWSGAETITFTATDPDLLFDADDALFTVNPVNDAPVAVADAYDTAEDTLLTVDAPGVLGNDSDAEADPLTAVLVDNVASGTLSLAADGSFTYEPAADFNGDVTFTYKANDGTSDSTWPPSPSR